MAIDLNPIWLLEPIFDVCRHRALHITIFRCKVGRMRTINRYRLVIRPASVCNSSAWFFPLLVNSDLNTGCIETWTGCLHHRLFLVKHLGTLVSLTYEIGLVLERAHVVLAFLDALVVKKLNGWLAIFGKHFR